MSHQSPRVSIEIPDGEAMRRASQGSVNLVLPSSPIGGSTPLHGYDSGDEGSSDCLSLADLDDVLQAETKPTDWAADEVRFQKEKEEAAVQREEIEKAKASAHKKVDEDDEFADEPLDNRVEAVLEALNSGTDTVNKVEVELDAARAYHRRVGEETESQLNALAKKLGSSIQQSRPYYSKMIVAKSAQQAAAVAATKFQQAQDAHKAARNKVHEMEKEIEKNHLFDAVTQNAFSEATNLVTVTELEKQRAYATYCKLADEVRIHKEEMEKLGKAFKRSILKAKPYYDARVKSVKIRGDAEEKVRNLENNYYKAKNQVAESLKRLNVISDEIHEQRRRRKLGLPELVPVDNTPKFEVLVLPTVPSSISSTPAHMTQSNGTPVSNDTPPSPLAPSTSSRDASLAEAIHFPPPPAFVKSEPIVIKEVFNDGDDITSVSSSAEWEIRVRKHERKDSQVFLDIADASKN